MSVGKLISQASHACLEASEAAKTESPRTWKAWHIEGGRKVVLKVNSLGELLELEKKAKRLKLPCSLIVDRGLTEIPPDTPTTLGIGPAKSELVDKVTGNLKLL